MFGSSPVIERAYPSDNPAIIDFLGTREVSFVLEKDGGKGNGLQKWVVR